ncbi:ABC transporter ATP-binding protein [Dinghuibacter silviterrae]|uniref:Putative ABC transport system ATP-binding protein n=1 Tax=Dinghuibacter silviterrae TaxID=1539049 RepID=A0A4R8DGY1_9BACT|nr:ATP-binding cassette domain-containing protein [Dinghuibacter silviterrae]TDW96648.1 putative ABC transport system ATP-binding protein [Dinghuibacter silviterrae]
MITLQTIQKVFNPGEPTQVTALNDVSLSIETGTFVVLVGSNGSGKTTLLNIIAGALAPSSGTVRFDDHDVTRIPEYRRSRWVARVFQNPLSGTAPELSILDNFRLAALRTTRKGLRIGSGEAFRAKVRDRIATLGMGLEAKIDQPMGTLSGGQRQALTLLMSVMDHTEILLLDEPTAALDPRSAALIMKTADQIARTYQLTTILITHNLRDAHTYGDRLILMGEGKVVRDLDAAAKGRLQLVDLAEWFG